MAQKLKDYYDEEFVRKLSNKIIAVNSSFDANKFISKYKDEYKDKEFLERQDLCVEALELSLNDNYSKNIQCFSKILGPELQTTTGMFSEGWWLWPIGRYVEKHGLEDFSVSINFIYDLTKRHTGEFSIRPLLKKHPKKVLSILLKWSLDENVHVRRLASEGIRIKLPWARRLDIFLEYFDECVAILNNLKNDKSNFVQKSVANNINDLMKVDRTKAVRLISAWKNNNPSKETLKIIKHGSRSLKKY